MMKNKRNLFAFCMAFCIAMLSVSCSDYDSGSGNTSNNSKPDLSTKISSSVHGFVTNENDDPVVGATIVAGNKTTTSDENGYFEIVDANVVKNYGVVSAEASGYFKGVRSWISETDKKQFVRIKLLPKTIGGTFKSADGGQVNLANGLKLTFPANAIVNKSDKTPYTGNVSVALQWISPTSATFTSEMPGDLRAVNSDGYLRSLVSFGMIAAELRGDAGQELQIAEGKTVAMRAPIETEQRAQAPTAMPLWFFDEAKGLWIEEGEARREGNEYVGALSHFSTWNLDLPFNYIRIKGRFVDENSNPIGGYYLSFKSTDGGMTYGGAYTDDDGYFEGYVAQTNNTATMILQTDCPFYSTSLDITGGDKDLGTIVISSKNLQSNVTNLSGTVVNCEGDPVTNGRVIYIIEKESYIVEINNGKYETPVYFCNNTNTAILKAYDYTTNMSASGLANLDRTQANTVVDPIKACSDVEEVNYISFNVEGKDYKIISDTDMGNSYIWFSASNGTSINFYDKSISIYIGHESGNVAREYIFSNINLYINDNPYDFDESSSGSITYTKYICTDGVNYDLEATFNIKGLLKLDGTRVDITNGKLRFKGVSIAV